MPLVGIPQDLTRAGSKVATKLSAVEVPDTIARAPANSSATPVERSAPWLRWHGVQASPHTTDAIGRSFERLFAKKSRTSRV